MEKIKTVNELYNFVQKTLGYRARMRYLDTEKKEVACILYDSFLLRCSIDDQYGRFGAGIVLHGELHGAGLTQFLGERCSLDSDPDSIAESLHLIDRYCRLRLPDKFLAAYDEAYK